MKNKGYLSVFSMAASWVIAGAIAGCGPQGADGTAASPPVTVSAPSSAPATGSAGPSATSSPSVSVTTQSAAAPSEVPSTERAESVPTEEGTGEGELLRFTFPDGHLSFEYPAEWTVSVKPGLVLPEGDPEASKIAEVSDGAGQLKFSVMSGAYGDGAAGPVRRTVIDTARVPALVDAKGVPVYYGFYRDQSMTINGETLETQSYALRLNSGPFPEGETNSLMGQVTLGNGVAVLEVPPPVGNTVDLAAARTWLESAEGQRIRAVALSLRYE